MNKFEQDNLADNISPKPDANGNAIYPTTDQEGTAHKSVSALSSHVKGSAQTNMPNSDNEDSRMAQNFKTQIDIISHGSAPGMGGMNSNRFNPDRSTIDYDSKDASIASAKPMARTIQGFGTNAQGPD